MAGLVGRQNVDAAIGGGFRLLREARGENGKLHEHIEAPEALVDGDVFLGPAGQKEGDADAVGEVFLCVGHAASFSRAGTPPASRRVFFSSEGAV